MALTRLEMTAADRFLFDMAGYMHIPAALTGAKLSAAQAAADRYIGAIGDDPPFASAPEGFGADLTRPDLTVLQHGFAFDPALEALTYHPATWPTIMELTQGRPRFTGGSLMLNTVGQWFHPIHAGWTNDEGHRPDHRRLRVEGGRVRCTDFICFWYLSDVSPGDGGLFVLPGSHKSQFGFNELSRDRSLEERLFFADPPQDGSPASVAANDTFAPPTHQSELPHGVLNLCPKAGDVLVISERLLHGALRWQPHDRDRRFLTLRYNVQHHVLSDSDTPFPQDILNRLSPRTIELASQKAYGTMKDCVRESVVGSLRSVDDVEEFCRVFNFAESALGLIEFSGAKQLAARM